MKRLVAVVVLLSVMGLVPAAALDQLEGVTLSISFFAVGLGSYLCLHERNWAAYVVGGFQIAVGVLGFVALACGWTGGSLIDEIRAGS
jgi:hypothetical protein